MSQEISAGRPVEGALSLRQGGVRPLRGTARAPESGRSTLSVEDLKNGGTLDLGGLLGESGPAGEERTLRQQAGGRPAPKASARQSRSAGLSLPERLQKLAQIKKSATEYEGLFVDQLVKLMRPSPLAHTPGGDTFSELAERPFRDFLSRAGGLGLAKTIVGQIARQEGLEQTLLEHPEVMGPSWRPTIPRNLGAKSNLGLALAPPGFEPQGPGLVSEPGVTAGAGRAEEPAEIAGAPGGGPSN